MTVPLDVCLARRQMKKAHELHELPRIIKVLCRGLIYQALPQAVRVWGLMKSLCHNYG